jgi:hypothetical protein
LRLADKGVVGPGEVGHGSLHLGEGLLHEVVLFPEVHCQVALECVETNLIAGLELSELLAVDLN